MGRSAVLVAYVYLLCMLIILSLVSPKSAATPSIYPTGVTIYKPEKCWNGYMLPSSGIPMPDGSKDAALFDMNGNIVKRWKKICGKPLKLLPGGYVMGTLGYPIRFDKHQTNPMVQMDWEGNIKWEFNKASQVKVPGMKNEWSARQNHDFQREGNPVGYYVPGMNPLVNRGNTLILSRKEVMRHKITDKLLTDSYIVEVTWDGKIIWDWLLFDHWDDLGLSEGDKNVIYRNPGYSEVRKTAREVYLNSISWVGPNKWFEAGDIRFHPENIICGIRSLNILFIISKKTKQIVWKLGPYYTGSPALRKMGSLISPHGVHIIPKGLPGEGHILVLDNGGEAGYGSPNQTSPRGVFHSKRYFSRVMEIDPLTLEVVWEYSAFKTGYSLMDAYKFFTPFCGNAQRLPNGNTQITEATEGRVFEVTPQLEIVWEWINPYLKRMEPPFSPHEFEESHLVYRAYRIPYHWIPQLEAPVERAVIPPNPEAFQIKPQEGTK